jgi:hypothetical protein
MTNADGDDLSFPFIDGNNMQLTKEFLVILIDIQGSIAEAAYMTGFDRNSDIVFAASYAPVLQVSLILRRFTRG